MGALPSAATRGHWFPLLELQAAPAFGPVPHLLEPAQPRHSLSPSSPGANTDPGERRGRLTEHPPFPGRRGRPGARPGLRPSVFAITGNEPMAQHPCYLSSQRNSPREHLPSQVAWEAGGGGCHSALSFSVLESDWAGSPVPKSPSPRTLSILFKPSKV